MVGVDTNKQLVLCCLCKAVLAMWSLKKSRVLKLLSVVVSSPHRSAVKQEACTFAEGIFKKFYFPNFRMQTIR